jgi:uncharacterized protein YbgA (DUF1722 family)
MSSKRFQAESFTPTKWTTAEQKAAFANQLMAFIAADFSESKFTKAFYNRLGQCFGMIAHYNVDGFFSTFFTDTPGKLRFLRCLVEWPCYGSSDFTFSDVERATSAAIRSTNYVETYAARLAREIETRERQTLAALQEKYRGGPTVTPAPCVAPAASEPVFVATRLPPHPAVSSGNDVQISLFG